jgi:antitoxin VapB
MHLPKEVEFPEGVRRVIVAADAVWDDFFSSPGIDLPPRAQPEAPTPKTFPSS